MRTLACATLHTHGTVLPKGLRTGSAAKDCHAANISMASPLQAAQLREELHIAAAAAAATAPALGTPRPGSQPAAPPTQLRAATAELPVTAKSKLKVSPLAKGRSHEQQEKAVCSSSNLQHGGSCVPHAYW